jgi:hypothetical protein
MSWPRFRLTKDEAKYNSKYAAPNSKPAVIRRIYPGFLEITETVRSPSYTFQISRRCRVMGMTISGDVERMRMSIIDITGEQFTADPTWIALMIAGWTQNPLSNIFPAVYTVDLIEQGQHYHSPLIFEPNIVLAPNQTLTIQGQQIQNFQQGDPDFRVDFCFHVYEFPGMPGSPR